MEADTEKKDFDIKNVKKKAQKMRKKAMERLRETRKRKGQKWRWSWNIKVEDAVQKWLVFFEKNLQGENNERKLEKDSITSSWYKIKNASSAKSSNPSIATTAGSDLTFVAVKTIE